MKKPLSIFVLAGVAFAHLSSLPSSVLAEEFGGIEFPQGAISFADEMISYDPSAGDGHLPTDGYDE